MDEKGVKQEKLTLGQILKNKQYRAIIYLCFYFVMFIILIIMARVGSGTTSNNENNVSKNNKEIVEGFSKIKERNYNFKYIVTVDDQETIYEGKQFDNKLLFKSNKEDLNYYIKDNVLLKQKGNDYVLSSLDNKYFDIFDSDIIEAVVEKSKYNDNNYSISSKEFMSIINSNDKIENEFSISINIIKHNNIITDIELDITNFAKLTDLNVQSVKISMKYSDFGLIDDFDIKQ